MGLNESSIHSVGEGAPRECSLGHKHSGAAAGGDPAYDETDGLLRAARLACEALTSTFSSGCDCASRPSHY
jgi:hypothetical protein